MGDDCLDEELETVDAEVADGGDVELSSGSSLRRSAANGVHMVCLTLTLAHATLSTPFARRCGC